MKVLYDFISIQGYINGGAEYTKRILKELAGIKNNQQIEIIALYDSKENFVNDDRHLFDKCFEEWVDVRTVRTIGTYCKDANIDVFFIGIGQRLMRYYLDDIECRTIMVIHDIDLIELNNSPVIIREKVPTLWWKLKQHIKIVLYSWGILKRNLSGQDKESFYKQKNFLLKKNVEIVTVSQFSKISIQYNIPFLQEKKINVFASPLRQETKEEEIKEIKNLQEKGVPYFLCLNSGRLEKNVNLAVNAVRVFNEKYPKYRIVTTGGMPSLYANHIGMGFVSDGELTYLLKNACALIYPTFIEGFGYPPIEAMRYGVPVIASRTTSIPEVVGDSALFFNPMFGSELYKALLTYIKMDKKEMQEKAKAQYKKVVNKQQEDLNQLMKKLLIDK